MTPQLRHLPTDASDDIDFTELLKCAFPAARQSERIGASEKITILKT
jgi:hypothetical protein